MYLIMFIVFFSLGSLQIFGIITMSGYAYEAFLIYSEPVNVSETHVETARQNGNVFTRVYFNNGGLKINSVSS